MCMYMYELACISPNIFLPVRVLCFFAFAFAEVPGPFPAICSLLLAPTHRDCRCYSQSGPTSRIFHLSLCQWQIVPQHSS